jgi:hypothetical protein
MDSNELLHLNILNILLIFNFSVWVDDVLRCVQGIYLNGKKFFIISRLMNYTEAENYCLSHYSVILDGSNLTEFKTVISAVFKNNTLPLLWV